LPSKSSQSPRTVTSIFWTTSVGLVLNDSVHQWTQSSLRDAGVLSPISAVFVLASILAGIVPARGAVRVDPMVALRGD